MSVFNLGSINIDKTYRVTHLPAPGETLGAYEMIEGLGGKGANMSVAAARGGAHVVHIGAVGRSGMWAAERLMEYGVDTRHISVSASETGHAVISVADDGENQILLWPGANSVLTQAQISAGIETISAKDIFITQNETNGQLEAAMIAKESGATVVYAAAPFEARAVKRILSIVDILVLNEIEAQQLAQALNCSIGDVPVSQIVITLGARGCNYVNNGVSEVFPAYPVDVVDTTGAGDTFTGYLSAGLDRGLPMEHSIQLAQRAAALMVGRFGTADVIPDLKEIEDAFS